LKKGEQDLKQKENNKILKQNDTILNTFISEKQKRHVKEPQEKIFKNLNNKFIENYGKLVVAKTTKEIMKFSKDGI
jgi:hypothetical protein